MKRVPFPLVPWAATVGGGRQVMPVVQHRATGVVRVVDAERHLRVRAAGEGRPGEYSIEAGRLAPVYFKRDSDRRVAITVAWPKVPFPDGRERAEGKEP